MVVTMTNKNTSNSAAVPEQITVLVTCVESGCDKVKKILSNKNITVQQEWPELSLLQVTLSQGQIDELQESEFIESIEVDETVQIQN